MKYILILATSFLFSSCGYDFIQPTEEEDEIEIKVDSTTNDYDVTVKI